MRHLWDEVAPAAPLLIPLGELLLWAVAFAVCVGVAYFAKAFLGATGSAVGWVPVVGGWLKSGIHTVERKIVTTMARAAEACDAKMGAALHSLARFVDKLGAEIARHAQLLLTIASWLPIAGTAENAVRNVLGLWKYARALVHKIEGIGNDLGAQIGSVTRGIGADVLPQIRSLDRRLNRELTRERARAKAAERAATREITNLWQWTKRHTLVAGSAAFAAAVAAALARLGLDWTRCESAKGFFKRRGCNAWNDLDGLLIAALAIATSMSLEELAKAEQEVLGDISTVVRDFWQV